MDLRDLSQLLLSNANAVGYVPTALFSKAVVVVQTIIW